MRVAPEIVLTDNEQAELVRRTGSGLANAQLAQRARIVLLAAQGIQNKDIAEELGVGRVQVARWRERYLQAGLAGIEHDRPRRAPAAKVDLERLVQMTTQPTPEPAPRRDIRAMTANMGISPASVSRNRRANALKPEAPGGVDLRRDVGAVENLDGVAGLYVSQSIRAMVLCCNTAALTRAPESRVRSWARAKPRSDTTTLFAVITALEAQDLAVASQAPPHVPWLKFLSKIDRHMPADQSLQVLAVDHPVHRHPTVVKWLEQHERFHVHTVSASKPWRASLERVLGGMGQKLLHNHAFASVPHLVTAIRQQIARPGPHRAPFKWTSGAPGVRVKVPGTATGTSSKTHAEAPRARKVPAKVKGRPMSRLSEDGDTLRDNVINLKRGRILQEAAKLFFELGYLQTSVDAIAHRLGATKPFVYYHFRSKADILVEICEKSNRDVLAAAESAMSAQGSPRVRFEQFLREFTHVALQQHQLVAIYFREEISLPADARDRIRQMRKSINMRLTALLNEGINSGEFQIEDPRIGALVIAGMSSYAFAWYRENGRLDQQEVTSRIVKMALKLVNASPFSLPLGADAD